MELGLPQGPAEIQSPRYHNSGGGNRQADSHRLFLGTPVPDSCHTPGSPSPSPSAVNWREGEGLSTRHSFRLLNPVVKAAEGPMDGMR